VLVDVLFGDVWFCSGQSNMQIGMAAVFNSTQELAKANNYPHIRILSVGQGTNSSTVRWPLHQPIRSVLH
jgi:sialate O-acetylesterase